MTIQPGGALYSANAGIRFENVEIPVIQTRAPTANDTNYFIGKRWIDLNTAEYTLVGISTIGGIASATWTLLGTDTGALNTLSDDSNVVVAPVAGNIQIAGTGSEIATTAGVGVITLSIPAAFIAPGSIASTTTLTAGSSLTVTTSASIGTTLAVAGTSTIHALSATSGTFSTTLGVTGTSTLGALTQVGTANINASGAAVTTIGTGGTGAVHIGNATGNTAVTGSLTASTGLTATTGGITASAGGAAITGTTNINTTGAAVTSINTGGTGALNLGNATGNTAVTGSLTTTTTLTATLGAITATNGNLVLASAGNKLVIHASTAASDSIGIGTLNGSGTVTITTTACTVNSKIWCQVVDPSGAGSPGILSVPSASIGAGSFVVNSSVVTDASTFFYLIIN